MIRRLIVHALHRACVLTDAIGLDRITHTHHLANLSEHLDDKWGTGVWEKATR